jgi:hypothetical protein
VGYAYVVNDPPEVPSLRVAILDADYHIECSNGFALSDRLPADIEDKVRKLTTSWGTDERKRLQRHCVLSAGMLMRVFVLLGGERYRVGVTLEPYA